MQKMQKYFHRALEIEIEQLLGLSVGVLIIEAKQKSGTGITADYAKRFGRPIFCIPHAIEDESGAGTNRWLKRGAILVTEISDILKYFSNIRAVPYTEPKIEIPEEYRKVYKLINGKLNADEISRKAKINISETNTILTMLELEGFIKIVI